MAMTPDQMLSIAGLVSGYGAAAANEAAAINQQTGYLLQARDTLAVAGVRADMSEQYAAIQAGRTLKKAEIEATNFQIAGNQLLKNLRSVNASARARAAAGGVALGSGSVQEVQNQNTAATMRDVGVADFNALAARVFGFEDASAMLESTQLQSYLTKWQAGRQAGQYENAASSVRATGGLLANASLMEAGLKFAKTYK